MSYDVGLLLLTRAYIPIYKGTRYRSSDACDGDRGGRKPWFIYIYNVYTRDRPFGDISKVLPKKYTLRAVRTSSKIRRIRFLTYFLVL
jgi:hypothetical protein